MAQQAPTPQGGLDFGAFAAGAQGNGAEPDEPGLLASTGQGILQGASLSWADEIESGLRSAFSDRKYSDILPEVRGRYARASEAHPIGFGLGEVLGSVGTGLATGGTGLAAKAGLQGAKGAAALAGVESAVAGAGASEDKTLTGVLGDAATSGAVGAGLGYGLHKIVSKYVDTAPERHKENLIKELTAGATPTESKRFAQGVGNLVVDVIEKDKEFLKAVRTSPEKGAEVVQKRLDDLAPQTKPHYDKIDADAGKVPLPAVVDHFDGLIDDAASKAGLERIRDALTETRDNFVKAMTRGLPEDAGIAGIEVPTQQVRQWVTRLYKQELQTWGGLNETAVHEIKEVVYDAADDFLRKHLDGVAKALPALEPTVTQLRELNKRIRAWASTSNLLEHVQDRQMWRKPNLFQTLRTAGLPGVAGVAAAGGDIVSGGLAYGGVKAAQAGADKLYKAQTQALAGLVSGARAGDAKKETAVKAIKAGVPIATVLGVLATLRNRPEWIDTLGERASNMVTGE